MSVYNSIPYLQEAIDSILNQSFRDFEVVIIDDGSTDASLELLQQYADRDTRIRLQSRENRGVSKTRNELLEMATGELVAVMDADDVAMPDRFAHQVEFLEREPTVVCVGGAYEMVDPDGKVLSLVHPPLSDAEIQTCLLSGSTAIQHPCAMARREALLQVGGYDETMTASIDLDLWLRVGEIGKLANLKEVVLKYRIHPNSVSERQTRRQSDDGRKACERAWQRRGIQGHFAAPKSWRHDFIVRHGFQLLSEGKPKAAIDYGIRAVRTRVISWASWKLLTNATVQTFLKRGGA